MPLPCAPEKELFPLPDKYYVFEEIPPIPAKLVAKPPLLRFFYSIELATAAVIFAISVYFSWITTTTTTVLTFDRYPSPWVCHVLNPRRDQEIYSLNSYESAQFSSPTILYDECLKLTGNTLNMCAQANRMDQIISIQGFTFNDRTCEDIILSNNYRFCWNNVTEVIPQASKAFPAQCDPSGSTCTFPTTNPYQLSGSSFFFTNTSGVVYNVSAPFAYSKVSADFITDNAMSVFNVVNQKIYQFNPQFKSAKKLVDLPLGPMDSIDGFAVGGGSVYVYSLSTTLTGTIYQYNYASSVPTLTTKTVACSSFSSGGVTAGQNNRNRFLSYGDDGNLYAMCRSSISLITHVNGADSASYIYSFYQVSASSGITSSTVLYTNLTQYSAYNVISQLIAKNGFAWALAGDKNVLKITLSPQPTPAPTSLPTQQPTPAPSPSPTQPPVQPTTPGQINRIPTYTHPPAPDNIIIIFFKKSLNFNSEF